MCIYRVFFLLVSQSFCVLELKETDLPNNTINIYYGKRVSFNSNTQKLLLETSKKHPGKRASAKIKAKTAHNRAPKMIRLIIIHCKHHLQIEKLFLYLLLPRPLMMWLFYHLLQCSSYLLMLLISLLVLLLLVMLLLGQECTCTREQPLHGGKGSLMNC